jgi:hypothetical protein
MPVKRRRSKRRENIEPAEWAFRIDEPYPNGKDGFVNWVLEFDYNGHATKRWCEYGEAATAEYVSKHPGRRPKLWWRTRRQSLGAMARARTSTWSGSDCGCRASGSLQRRNQTAGRRDSAFRRRVR